MNRFFVLPLVLLVSSLVSSPLRADMMADSPIKFPDKGALPAKYPPDQPAQDGSTPEQGYYLFSSPERSLAQIDRIQSQMPPGTFSAPPQNWRYLRRTRQALTRGGHLELLALGDSIVNDTMRSGWVARLRQAYPKADIHATVYVRGGGGCQHYKEEGRVARFVVPRHPDLVFIGGISQKDIESIREVIHQLRQALPQVEIVLATGAFGTADPRVAKELAKAPYSGTGPYGVALKKLAGAEHCAYLDMTTPWAEYIRSSKLHPYLFYRDVVHANEFGEQILCKILTAYWNPAGVRSSATAKPTNKAPLRVTPVAAFPLKASNNHRYVVDRDGKPFFLLADTPWFLQKLPIEDVRRILDDRVQKGFNTLFLEILDDSALPSRDAYGNVAFEPPLDITRPVESYWRYADAVMEEATKRGFYVIMSDLWYGAGKGLWMHHVTPESARVYGHFLGKRYARFQNLMWMQCGDRNPDQRLKECARVLARAIHEEAPHQLQTAHLQHEFASASFFQKDNWLDVNMAYTYGAAYLQVLQEYARTDPVRPVILGETGYEGEPNAIELLPDAKKGDLWTPYKIRRNAWWAVLSGASGYCGGTRLWRFESNWREVLNARSTREAPLLRRFFEPLPWWRLIPDTDRDLMAAGGGPFKSANWVAAARADDGSLAVIYVPGPTTLKLDLARMKSSVKAKWFDPTSGEFRPVSGAPFPNRRAVEVMTPGRNEQSEPDWVLLLEAKE